LNFERKVALKFIERSLSILKRKKKIKFIDKFIINNQPYAKENYDKKCKINEMEVEKTEQCRNKI